MHIRRSLLALLVATAVAAPVRAQGAASAQCTLAPAGLRDACQKGTDMFTLLMPQVQGALGGGSPIPGTARSMRGVTFGLRVTAVDGDVPTLSSVSLSTTGIVRSALATKRAPVPMPTLDLAVPFFPGFFAGPQRLFSVDLLANVSYMPSSTLEDFSVKATNGSLKLGFGARVGVLADRMLMPAVSVSFVRRTLPTATFAAAVRPGTALNGAAPDSISLNELSVRNDAIRIALSKHLGFLELGGGVGQDSYRTFAQLGLRVNTSLTSAQSNLYVLTQEMKRRTAYGSAAVNIARLRLSGEVGATFDGDSLSTYNTFADGRLNERRLFGTVGLQLRF